MLNLASLLETSARAVPERTAVVPGVKRLTYAELDAAACRVAGLLHSRGVGPGDKVALSCPNLPWFPIVYYGILKAGAVVVPLPSSRIRTSEPHGHPVAVPEHGDGASVGPAASPAHPPGGVGDHGG
ncbi:AMP-binding protein [Streptomyces sp. NPDC091265]|uniref:AMP-binding protein n=1 Tax=Streptomyces sp. NPDC091265 TaxID=3365977 RepID=UPI0037F270F9